MCQARMSIEAMVDVEEGSERGGGREKGDQDDTKPITTSVKKTAK